MRRDRGRKVVSHSRFQLLGGSFKTRKRDAGCEAGGGGGDGESRPRTAMMERWCWQGAVSGEGGLETAGRWEDRMAGRSRDGRVDGGVDE